MQKLPDVMITKMITFNNKIIYKNQDPYLDKVKFSNKGKEEILELIFNNIYNVWPAWRYIVKGKFVESKRIRFPEGLLHEDLEWTTQILFFAESFGKMDTFWYYHRKDNSTSITNNITLQNSLDIINQIVSNLKMIQNQKCTLKTQKIFTKRLTMSLFPTLLRYFNIDKNSRKKIAVLFKKNKEVFKKNNCFRYQLFLTLTDLLGLDFSLRLYRIYITMKKQIMKKNEKI